MKVGTITKTRRSRTVHPITIEIDSSLYDRMIGYCISFERSKRWIMEDALNCWINQRDMEAAKHSSKEGK